MVEPALLDADTLVSSLSGKSFENDEQFYDSLGNLGSLPPFITDIFVLFCKHLGDEINFEVLNEYVGIKGRISGEGLNQILKSGLKFAE